MITLERTMKLTRHLWCKINHDLFWRLTLQWERTGQGDNGLILGCIVMPVWPPWPVVMQVVLSVCGWSWITVLTIVGSSPHVMMGRLKGSLHWSLYKVNQFIFVQYFMGSWGNLSCIFRTICGTKSYAIKWKRKDTMIDMIVFDMIVIILLYQIAASKAWISFKCS